MPDIQSEFLGFMNKRSHGDQQGLWLGHTTHVSVEVSISRLAITGQCTMQVCSVLGIAVLLCSVFLYLYAPIRSTLKIRTADRTRQGQQV
jgi:hypothetical protein